MLAIGLTLLAAAILLLLLAFRGRITARGRFCRKCKFDLAGLTDPSACPECGTELRGPKATRPELRRVRWFSAATAVLLLLSGVGLAGYSIVSPATSIYARLPDGALLLLERIGIDGALSEIANRSDSFPGFSDTHLQTVLRRGLQHQADTSVPWDPRWGQVLANAFLRQQMTPEQMQAYIEAGIKPDVRIRDRAAADNLKVGYQVRWLAARITTPNTRGGGMASIYDAIMTIDPVGVVTADKELAGQGLHQTRSVFFIPAPGTDWGGASRSEIHLPKFDPAESPQEVVAYVEVTLSLETAGSDGGEVVRVGPLRVEQTVRIVPAGSEVVGVIADAAAASAVRNAVEIGGISIDLSEPENIRWNGVRMPVRLTTFDHAVAWRVCVVFDGEETQIGRLNVSAGQQEDWRAGSSLRTERDEMATIGLLRSWSDAGSVDVVFRTDTQAALINPEIEDIIDVTLWFRDVPVAAVDQTPVPRSGIRAEGAEP